MKTRRHAKILELIKAQDIDTGATMPATFPPSSIRCSAILL